jgi:sulfur carrier protein
MDVFVNDQKHSVHEDCTLEMLVGQLNFESLKGIAIAVGESVVPRSNWEATKLVNGDQILIIRATQGG